MPLPQNSRPIHLFRDFLPDSLGPNDCTIEIGVLCEPCSRIQDWLTTNWDTACQAARLDREFVHHESGVKLEDSFKSGCHMCTHIWYSLTETENNLDHNSQLKRRMARLTKLRRGNQVSVSVRRPSSVRRLQGALLGLQGHVQLEKTRSHGSILILKLRKKDTSAIGEGTGAAALGQTRTASAASFAQVKRWIRQCTQSHRSCQQTPARALPRRLLKIISRGAGRAVQMMHLVETSGLSDPDTVQYACLSYCWGGASAFKLTQSTRLALQTGIRTDQLPKTIQHAVYTTSQLGLQWLWVDSLCIVQDSQEDWEREAAEMFDIYRGCHITIAALGASNSDDGLFANRDPLMYAPCPLISLAGDSDVCVYSTRSLVFTAAYEEWPLYKRGWVMQERVIAPRTVKFGPFLSWECRELKTDEFDFEPSSRNDPICGTFYRSIQEHPGLTAKYLDGRNLQQLYLSLVSEFSEAELSIKSDRLQAISGIISAIQSRTGWDNASGLWVPFINRELLWKKTYDNTETRRTGLRPSWSWISLNGGIYHYMKGAIGDNLELANVEVQRVAGLPTVRDPALQNVPAVQILCAPIPVLDMWRGEYNHTLRLLNAVPNEQHEVWFFFDIDTEPVTPKFFVPIEAEGDTIHGLGIAPSQHFHGSYERVGYGTWRISLNRERLQSTFAKPELLKSVILI